MLKRVRLFTLFILFTILTLNLTYNACSPYSFYATKFSKLPDNLLRGFRAEINNGSYSTSTLENVPLRFEAPAKNSRGETTNYEMKISQASDCSDGEWKPYQERTTWTFQPNGKEERLLFIYVKFREKEPSINYNTKNLEKVRRESHCIYKSIVYDKVAPRNLTLYNQPTGRTSQKRAEFRFTAEDYSPIHFECHLKRIPKGTTTQEVLFLWSSCTSGITYGSSDLAKDGEYIFQLRARDLAGNKTEPETESVEYTVEHTWIIDSTAPSLTIGEEDSNGTFVKKCPDDSSSEVESVLVKALNLDLPIEVYCSNPAMVSCGTINVNNNPLRIRSNTPANQNNFVTEEKATDYLKKTVFLQALNSTANPARCIWHEDTKVPDIQWAEKGKLEYSFGSSITPNDPSAFKIRIDDNSILQNSGNNDITIKYKVHNSDGDLVTCTDPPGANHTSSLVNGWCELSNDSPPYPIKVTPEDEDKDPYLTQMIYIDQGLVPFNESHETPFKHTIQVKVEDAVGNTSSTLNHPWDVYGEIKETVSTQSISSNAIKKVDILFVIDDSGVKSNIDQLGESFPGLISQLSSEGFDWQVAITSMERSGTRLKKLGKLVRLIDNETNSFFVDENDEKYKYILSSQTTCDFPLYCSSDTDRLELIFKRTIAKKNTGENHFTFSGSKEYGIQSINVLLDYYDTGTTTAEIAATDDDSNFINENYRSPTNDELDAIESFFREDSTFVVILITDEKNCGCDVSVNACNSDNYNKRSFLVESVARILGEDKKFIFYPIIPDLNAMGNTSHCAGGYSLRNAEDDYWKLAEITQGKTSPLWIDFNHKTDSRNPGENRRSLPTTDDDCEPHSDLAGAYRKDLCIISKDISRTTTGTIQLECKPTSNLPDSDDYKTKYFYTPNIDANENDQLFESIERRGNTLRVEIAENEIVNVTINDSWNNNSSPQTTNRLILTSHRGNDIPHGTYKVKYFCHSEDGS